MLTLTPKVIEDLYSEFAEPGPEADFKKMSKSFDELANKACEGDATALRELVETATLSTTALYRIYPRLVRSIARQKPLWPVIASAWQDFSEQNEKYIREIQLGEEITPRLHSLTKRTEELDWAEWVYRTIDKIRKFMLKLREPLRDTKGETEFDWVLSGAPFPSWARPLPFTPTPWEENAPSLPMTILIECEKLEPLSCQTFKQWWKIAKKIIKIATKGEPERHPTMRGKLPNYRRSATTWLDKQIASVERSELPQAERDKAIQNRIRHEIYSKLRSALCRVCNNLSSSRSASPTDPVQ